MSVHKPGDDVTHVFAVQNPLTGALTNADSLPTGTISKNGTTDAAVTVTVTNKTTGQYKAAFTIPATYAIGDEVDLVITAIVGGVSTGEVVWRTSLE